MSNLIRPNYSRYSEKRAMREALRRKLDRDPMDPVSLPPSESKTMPNKVRNTAHKHRKNPRSGI